MTTFAQVKNGIVQRVIVAEQDFINTLPDDDDWIKTDRNTFANQHNQGSTPLRGNYAGIGFTYDRQNDVFYPPKPFSSWVLNESTWLWDAPVPYPTDGKMYQWNEETKSWVEVTK